MYQLAQRAMLLDRPLPGMQTYDVLRAFDYLAARQGVKSIAVHGNGNLGLVALYAAALEPRIARVQVRGAVSSFMEIVRTKVHADTVDLVIPGVLHDFDIPDVLAAIKPRPVDIMSPRDPATRLTAAAR
jgi:hypothetical protein